MRSAILLLFAWCALHARAQEHRFTRFGLNEGLPALQLGPLAQDSSHQIWVGTIAGLARFDGQRFHNYFAEPGNERSLKINTVSDLLCDRNGLLWVSTGGDMHQYHPSTDDFSRVSAPPLEGYIRFALQGDRMWINDVRDVYALSGTADRPLWEPMPFVREAVKDQIMQLRFEGDVIWLTAANGLWKGSVRERTVHRVMLPGMPSGSFIAEVCERLDPERLLVTTWGAGFLVINERNGTCTRYDAGTSSNITYAALAVDGSRAWVGTDNGLLLFDALQGTVTQCSMSSDDPWSVPFGLYTTALRDHEGGLWFGGSAGIVKRDVLLNTVRTGRAEPLELMTALRGLVTGVIILDEQDVLLSTLRGVHRLHRGQLERVEGLSGTPGSGQTYPMLRLNDTTVLVGLETSIGSIDLREEPMHVRRWATLPVPAHAFVRRADGNILVLTDSTRAYMVGERSEAAAQNIKLLPGYIASADLFEDRWLLVNQRHYGSVVDLSTGKAIHFAAGALDKAVPQSVRAEAGMLTIDVQESYFTAMRFSTDGRVLLGSRTDGLLRCERDLSQVEYLRERLPSIDRSVLRILPFGDQQVWLSTHNGMLLLDMATGTTRRFNADYGLLDGPSAAMAATADGALMKLDLDRSVFIDPASVPRLPEFDTRIASIRVNGALVADNNDLELPSDATSIRIGVVSSALAQHGLKRYRYRLSGGGTEQWTDLGNANEIVFENLASGSYTLEVRSTNALGMDDEAGATLAFSIAKPFYRTWWFILLLALVPVLVAALLFRARIQRIKEAQDIRNRIARDLHDDLGSSISAITIYGGVLEKKLAGVNGELEGFAGTIHRAGKAASEAVADIVWAEDPAKDDLAQTVARMRAYFNEVVVSAGLQGGVVLEGAAEGVALDGRLRRDLFLVFKESINNALKHAGAQRLEVTVANRAGVLSLRIADDGAGLAQHAVARGNGLRNMRDRMERHGGTFAVAGGAAGGTVVTVVLAAP